MFAGVLVAIVIVAVLWAIVSDNSLVGQRNQVANGMAPDRRALSAHPSTSSG
jgi:hypothetical protein